MPSNVKPLGEIKPGPNGEYIWFRDASGNRGTRISSVGNTTTVGIGNVVGIVVFDRSQVESLIAHLEAWLKSGSFELKDKP